jgi:threonylcarbamoyladenosine tRNA methylthiotransferase MtaB
MQIHLKALGCRLNEAELEKWAQDFIAAGHVITNQSNEADIVVLNTCSVTQDAGKKSRKLLNRLYRENPTAKLVASGCHATLSPNELADSIGVDLIVPNQQKDQLAQQVLERFNDGSMPTIATEPGETSLFSRGRQRAFIKIQDGCRYRCSFCIVTIARGEERSRSEVDIINEINRLQSQGINEIVLTGVHVGGYGSDTNTSLYDLVNTILEQTDIPRIRFASVEPWDLHDNFFSLFDNQRLMPHIHLPLQSGADSILRKMSRRCRTDDFRALVEQARSSIKNFNVTSDIIVGFPNESDTEWQQTMDYVESIGFGHLHIFSYSPREGTKAARLPNPVPNTIKKCRHQAMYQLGEQMKQAMLSAQLNKTVNVLWERGKPCGSNVCYTGYTPNFLKVETQVAAHIVLENTITSTQLTQLSAGRPTLMGTISS